MDTKRVTFNPIHSHDGIGLAPNTDALRLEIEIDEVRAA